MRPRPGSAVDRRVLGVGACSWLQSDTVGPDAAPLPPSRLVHEPPTRHFRAPSIARETNRSAIASPRPRRCRVRGLTWRYAAAAPYCATGLRARLAKDIGKVLGPVSRVDCSAEMMLRRLPKNQRTRVGLQWKCFGFGNMGPKLRLRMTNSHRNPKTCNRTRGHTGIQCRKQRGNRNHNETAQDGLHECRSPFSPPSCHHRREARRLRRPRRRDRRLPRHPRG